MDLFVHVLGRIVQSGRLERLSASRNQVKDGVRGEFETRTDLLIGGRLKLYYLGLVPDFDHVCQRLQTLGDQVFFGRLEHQLLDEVDHLVDQGDPHG